MLKFFSCMNNKMLPTIWGKHLWFSIHFVALDYPDSPEQEHIQAYKDFYTNLWKVIPCFKCAVNYKRHLQELPIDGHLHSQDALFAWTVALHNIVNKELGKPEMSLEEAKIKYTDPDFNIKMCQTVKIMHNMVHPPTGATSSNNDKTWAIGGLFIGIIIGVVVMIIIGNMKKRK